MTERDGEKESGTKRDVIRSRVFMLKAHKHNTLYTTMQIYVLISREAEHVMQIHKANKIQIKRIGLKLGAHIVRRFSIDSEFCSTGAIYRVSQKK